MKFVYTVLSNNNNNIYVDNINLGKLKTQNL